MERQAFVELHEPGDPTLVMLHGTGGDEKEMFAFGRQLSQKKGILSLRGHEPEGSVNRWFRRRGEGIFDEPNLIFRANELADHIISALPNEKRVGVGFSNGANIAAALLLLRPDSLHGAVLLAPMVPLTPENLPDLGGKPILMICGEQDPIVPRANAQTLASMLQTAGADLTVHWHSGGHGIGQLEFNVASAFIAQI